MNPLHARSRFRSIATVTALLGAGILVGLFARRVPVNDSSEAPAASDESVLMRQEVMEQRFNETNAILASLAQRIENLAANVNRNPTAASEAETASAKEDTTSPPAETATPSQIASAARARLIFESAISRQKWTESDRNAMREAFASTDNQTRMELLRELSVAINNGDLVMDRPGIPL